MVKNIYDISFEELPDEVIQQKWEKRINEPMTEKELQLLGRTVMPSCKMSILADNNIMLYRVAKSSEEIARNSYEHHEFIPHDANSVVEDIYKQNGLSLTTMENLILCLVYGDIIVEVLFDKERLRENNMLDMKVFRTGNGVFIEYIADKILTGNVFYLSNPNTLKKVIEFSDNQHFEIALNACSFWPDLGKYFKKFGLDKTAKYWKLIKNRYNELTKLNVNDKINILRTELDYILTCV